MTYPAATPHWTSAHQAAAAAATSLDDLVVVARDILAVQAAEQELAIVLGPMTTGGLGSAERNFRAFRAAVAALRATGHNIFDIADFHDYIQPLSTHNPDAGTYDTAILETFCDGVYGSGHIAAAYFLPGWESSVGARWERDRMPTYGIAVREYPADLWATCLRGHGLQ